MNTEKILSYKEVTLNTVSNQLISMEEDAEASTCKVEASMMMLPQLAVIDEYYSLLFILLGEKHKHCICKRLTNAGFFAGGEFLFTDDDTKEQDKIRKYAKKIIDKDLKDNILKKMIILNMKMICMRK